ncbi:MAG: helix-turn-helix domain-containing protein [Lachnospiraceae bacterium]|nr:helix-turn-helix domain-containing protein [Lachnospiraceae bacterium]
MFGKRLNNIRKRRGFTAQKMADILSVSIRTYRHYESGHTFPSPDTLVKIADTLNVSIDYLLGRDEWLKSRGVFFGEF